MAAKIPPYPVCLVLCISFADTRIGKVYLLSLGSRAIVTSGRSIQVIIDEVPEGNWGAGGQTISLESIAGTVGMPTNGGRFAWVRSYFEAKARQLAAFGYPDDVGGLLPSLIGNSRKRGEID